MTTCTGWERYILLLLLQYFHVIRTTSFMGSFFFGLISWKVDDGFSIDDLLAFLGLFLVPNDPPVYHVIFPFQHYFIECRWGILDVQ